MEHPLINSPLLLLTGMGRSGTTVLRHCIAKHPEILCLNQESNYLFHLLRAAHLHIDNEFARQNLQVGVGEFWELHHRLILQLLFPSVDASHAGRSIATYSMMDPRSALALSSTFPQLSILWVVRNGIEVVSSYRSFGNLKHLSFEEVCRTWAAQLLMFQYVRDHENGTMIRHECLADTPDRLEEFFTPALQRVGLSFHPACREPLHREFHPTKYAGESRTDRKDRSRRKDRWKLWTMDERETFVQICQPAMDMIGYEIPWV